MKGKKLLEENGKVGKGATVSSGGNRMDRRRMRTRSALMGAGQRLFAAKHFEGVTIDDIVDAADVAKGSFYNHFDGKESLADAIVELVQGDCEREVTAVNMDVKDPAKRVARAMASMIRYAQHHPDRYRSMVNLTRRQADINAPINDGARHDIESGLATGQFSNISVETGVAMMLGMIAYAVEYFASDRPAGSRKEIGKDMAFMLLRALGVPSEQAMPVAVEAFEDIFAEGARTAAE